MLKQIAFYKYKKPGSEHIYSRHGLYAWNHDTDILYTWYTFKSLSNRYFPTVSHRDVYFL